MTSCAKVKLKWWLPEKAKLAWDRFLATCSNQAQEAFSQAAQSLGQLASLISVPDCWEQAVAALLGQAGVALAIEDSQLEAGLQAVKGAKGQVSWVVSRGESGSAIALSDAKVQSNSDEIAATEVISAPKQLHSALKQLLDSCYLATDLGAAKR